MDLLLAIFGQSGWANDVLGLPSREIGDIRECGCDIPSGSFFGW